MNAKLLLKTFFFIALLLLLVLMVIHNTVYVTFRLPPIIPKVITQPAALIYFEFFAVGVLTGTIMTAGIGSKGGGSKSSDK
jgi:hypothetical protein